ncbi:hypothetical protein lerEdw1_008852, partial [Lerista edwardsae]
MMSPGHALIGNANPIAQQIRAWFHHSAFAGKLPWAQDGAGWGPPQKAPFPLALSTRGWLLFIFLPWEANDPQTDRPELGLFSGSDAVFPLPTERSQWAFNQNDTQPSDFSVGKWKAIPKKK